MPKPNADSADFIDDSGDGSFSDILADGGHDSAPDDGKSSKSKVKSKGGSDDGGSDDGNDSGASSKSKPKRNYKTWDEAEKAVLEAKKKMTDAAEEAAKLRRKLESYESDDVKKKGDDPISKIKKEMGVKIKALDNKDPDYDQKVLDILFEGQQELYKVEDKKKASQARTQKDQLKYVTARLKEEGLEEYEEEFWDLSGAVPPNIKSVEKAVEWGIDRLKSLLKKTSDIASKRKQDEENKDAEDFVFGSTRLSGPKQKTKVEGPESISDTIKALRRERIVKG